MTDYIICFTVVSIAFYGWMNYFGTDYDTIENGKVVSKNFEEEV